MNKEGPQKQRRQGMKKKLKSASIYLALKRNGHIKNASPEHDSLWKTTRKYPNKDNILPCQFNKYLL